jgi:DNA-binding NarL/FixJ family response regulator
VERRVRVAICADAPAEKARIAALLNDAADIALVDEAADILVIVAAPGRALEAAADAPKPILLVDRVDIDRALDALRAGARAVLPLDAEAMTLAHAVRAVVAGLVVLHPAALHAHDRAGPAFLPESDELTEPLEPLTDRELQVLHLLADGLSNKAIARRLAISEHTVKFHLAAVFAKLDAKSRAEALAQGIRFGLVHL